VRFIFAGPRGRIPRIGVLLAVAAIVACNNNNRPDCAPPVPDPANKPAEASAPINKNPAPVDGTLARVIMITTGQACRCTLNRCKRWEEALKRALAKHPKAPAVERFDYNADKDKAKELMDKYPSTMPPAVYFLNPAGELLWKVEGDFDWTEVDAALKKYVVAAP